jgi:hypothetical protein
MLGDATGIPLSFWSCTPEARDAAHSPTSSRPLCVRTRALDARDSASTLKLQARRARVRASTHPRDGGLEMNARSGHFAARRREPRD